MNFPEDMHLSEFVAAAPEADIHHSVPVDVLEDGDFEAAAITGPSNVELRFFFSGLEELTGGVVCGHLVPLSLLLPAWD